MAEPNSLGFAFRQKWGVQKPVKFSEFADAVSALGLFWLLLNETVTAVIPDRSER